jgi:hypothetical protein
MIAKGNLHAHGVKLAAYLITSSADERAELVELKGFAATNLRDAFIDVQMQAAATRATKPFFHAYVRLPKGEADQLAPEDWRTIVDRMEKELGFAGQPRAVAFHNQADGERHMHIAWSRIDLASLTAIDPGLYKNKLKSLCREFEKEFGLTEIANERGADVKTKAADRAEFEQARRLNTDLKAIRNTIHECWQSADSGQAFAAALAEQGLILAKGDQRPFVIIDREGGDHALSKRITSATAVETRQRMADIDRASLPSVDDAKALQRAANPEPRPARTKGMSDTDTQEATPTAPNADARPDADAARHAEQRERLIRDAARLAEADRAQAEMRPDIYNARNYREQVEREAEAAKKNEQERQQKDAARASAGDITDAQNRYAQALGSTYSVRDPYGSLANAAMVEYAGFHKQQDALRKDAAAEKDPDKRRVIDLRREIEGHDYMAITSERLAGIGRAIAMGHNDGTRRDDELAKTHTNLASEKRQERAELQREMAAREKDKSATTERGGIDIAAQQGAAAQQRERSRPRSQLEKAIEKAAERGAAPTKHGDEAKRTAQQQDEQTKKREGLSPDQPTEAAKLPSEVARGLSKLEKAIHHAAGKKARDPAEPTHEVGRPQGRPTGRGGGRGR